MRRRIIGFICIAGMALHPCFAWAQGAGHPHTAQPTEASPQSETDSTTAFKAANAKMHEDMDIEYTGNADIDFMRGMIAHHQGAVDMAQIVIREGKDPSIRTLAKGVIAAQKKEIAFMKKWLEKQEKDKK